MKIKNDGKGNVRHYPRISSEDMKKVYSIEVTNPLDLQLKVWFNLQLQFAWRGRENLYDMKIEDLKFQELNGKKFVILKDKVTKNHRESDGSVSSEARIYEHCDKSLCVYTLL